jgi:hypothetical protein
MTNAAAVITKPTPRGMIEIDGVLRLRRSGFADAAELHCWDRHRIKINPVDIPMAGSLPCKHKIPPHGEPCRARLYVMRIQARMVFAMDITHDETRNIHLASMDLDDIIAFFGLSFPARISL